MVKISRDHHAALLFCWRIRNGVKHLVEPNRIKSYIHYFWDNHLLPHFKQEEAIIFPLVEMQLVERALKEHQQITEIIVSITSDNDEVEILVPILADAIDEHIRHEDRELFPLMESMLTLEQLKGIKKRMFDEYDPELKDDFEDEFWLNK